MPGSAVDDVVVRLEVLVVAHAAVGVGHHQVGRGVDGGQPAEESVVRRGGVLLRGPVTGAVEGVRNHQFSPVEVRAEHEGNILHPVDHGTSLRCNLAGGVDRLALLWHLLDTNLLERFSYETLYSGLMVDLFVQIIQGIK